MADSRTRTTLNLSGLSSRIEQLRSDSAWRILPLSKKVMLLLEEYLTLIESEQARNLKLENATDPFTIEGNHITPDFLNLSARLKSISTKPDQSLESLLIWAATLWLDLLDASHSLKLPPPRIREIRTWLVEIRNANPSFENSSREDSVSVIKYLSSLKKRPSNAEIVKVAAKLRIDENELILVCDRMFPVSENGLQKDKHSELET